MSEFSYVKLCELSSARLDAEYYGEMYVENAKKITAFGNVSTLEEMRKRATPIRRGIDMPDFVDDDSAPLMVTIAAFEDPGICFKGLQRVSMSQHQAFKGSHIQPGDLLVAMGGYAGNAAICPPDTPAANIGRHTARVVLEEAKADTYYVWSFIRCKVGTLQFDRYITGSVQAGINLEDIRDISIATPNPSTQKYIGDKVRQAEQLRACAKQLEYEVNDLFTSEFSWNSCVLCVSNMNRLSVSELQNRLDLKYNSPRRLAALRHAKHIDAKLERLDRLVDISAMIGWKGLTTEHYREKGPWLLRGVEFSNGVIFTEDLVCVDEGKYAEQPQIHLVENDIAFSKDGTIGKAIVIPRLINRIAAGSTIARLRKKNGSNIDPYYLEYVLSHEFVQAQIESFATGVAQPHITQEWIALLQIPRLFTEEEISSRWRTHHNCLNIAKQLTTAAKQLVEALIEGQIDENQLITAQNQLQAGNDSLDRSILARLKADGLDGQGQPLFADLDQLYSLLTQAMQA